MSAHLVPLFDGWALWRSFCLRGAGFPAAMLSSLSLEDTSPLDRWISCEEAVDALRHAAIHACQRVLEGDWGPQQRGVPQLLRKLEAGRPAGREPPPVLAEPLAALTRAEAARDAARSELDAHLAREGHRVGARLRELVRDVRFREAVTWQNRALVHTSFDPLLAHGPDTHNKSTRKYEATIASYLQRYCVKNDSIGFFGPIGFGTLEPGAAFRFAPGPGLVRRRTVYFERWAIDALAGVLSQDPQLKPWIAPRRMPTLRVEGTRLHHPIEQTSELPEAHAWVLAACNGEEPARSIAARAVMAGVSGLERDEDVYETLEELESNGLVTWTLELPTVRSRPEEELRALLDNVGDPSLREKACAPLEALCERRDSVARAAGDPTTLDHALESLEQAFVAQTHSATGRAAGETYAGRGLVFEDCVRDLDCAFGVELLDQVAPALALIFTSARWYTYEVARRYRALLTDAYHRLRADGPPAVDFLRYWQEVSPELAARQDEAPPIAREVAGELRRRWSELLAVPDGARRVERTAGELAAAVARAFDAPHPGWQSARHVSPDLLIAAASPEAIARGDFQVVLGEVHTSGNSLMLPPVLDQHPDPDFLLSGLRADLGAVRIGPVLPKERHHRAAYGSPLPEDVDVETGRTRSWRARGQVIAIADLLVEDSGRGPIIRTRAGDHRFDLIAFFEYYMMVATFGHFSILPSAPHKPRVAIDRLIVARERWSFTANELPFAHLPTAEERFLSCYRWSKRQRLPRHVFTKVVEEAKPVYVDFHSPIGVESFCKTLRHASGVSLTEMLPGHDSLWLEDAGRRRYTCELRLAAVDPRRWPSPAEV